MKIGRLRIVTLRVPHDHTAAWMNLNLHNRTSADFIHCDSGTVVCAALVCRADLLSADPSSFIIGIGD